MDGSNDAQRSGIRKSLLLSLNTMSTSSMKGGLTSEENAKSLAKRMFDGYNKDHSDHLEDFELSVMISDVYKAIGKQYNPTPEDIQQYAKVLDIDKDGRVTLRDFENLMLKYLV